MYAVPVNYQVIYAPLQYLPELQDCLVRYTGHNVFWHECVVNSVYKMGNDHGRRLNV